MCHGRMEASELGSGVIVLDGTTELDKDASRGESRVVSRATLGILVTSLQVYWSHFRSV